MIEDHDVVLQRERESNHAAPADCRCLLRDETTHFATLSNLQLLQLQMPHPVSTVFPLATGMPQLVALSPPLTKQNTHTHHHLHRTVEEDCVDSNLNKFLRFFIT